MWFGRGIKKATPFERGGQNDVAKLIFLRVIGLDGFRLDDDCGVATGERTALGGDDVIELRRTLEQLSGAGLRQLTIAKDNEAGNAKLVIQRANRQIALAASDRHMIMRIHVNPSFVVQSQDQPARNSLTIYIMALISAIVNENTPHTCPNPKQTKSLV